MAQSDDTVTAIRSFKAFAVYVKSFHTQQYFDLACKKYFRMHYRIQKYLHKENIFYEHFLTRK